MKQIEDIKNGIIAIFCQMMPVRPSAIDEYYALVYIAISPLINV